ncbi:MAG: hypothetical protein WCG80_00230 [Spirochaetales bacterium]
MEKVCDFLLGASDPSVSALFKGLDPQSQRSVQRCFNQEEELFLELAEPLEIRSLDVHHDINNAVPSPQYAAAIDKLGNDLAKVLPAVFSGLTWFFDPRDTLHPLFVQMLSAKDKRYLYVLRVDLTWRPRHGEVLERGTNSRTPHFRTKALFLESEVLPLASLDATPTEKRLYLAKLFQNTWKGESGRRYHVEGQWIDQDITKFLSRMVLTPGRKTFPFYPLRCRYNTLSASCVDLEPEGRRKAAAILDTAWGQIASSSTEIQDHLQAAPFSEDLPLFQRLREVCRPLVEPRLGDYRLEPYLNADEQKEYRYHG